jgi:hypothetical protein
MAFSSPKTLVYGDSSLGEIHSWWPSKYKKEYGCNNDMMAGYLAEVRKIKKFFNGFEVRYVPRLDNRDVDHLGLEFFLQGTKLHMMLLLRDYLILR